MGGGGVRRISMSLPPELLRDFDATCKKMGYDERSKVIQIAMRNFMSEYEWTQIEDGLGSGVLMLIYDHEAKGLEEALTDIQHRFTDVVSSTLHIHLDERNCLVAIVVKGRSQRIRSLGKQFTKLRGIKHFRASFFRRE